MKYLPRIVDERISDLLEAVPIVIIEGARATGKTTTASRLAGSEIRLPRDLEMLSSDPTGVLARLTKPVLIDEWQLAGTNVLWAVKDLVDEDPRPGSFLLTGSVEPESYGPTYPLTGRSARVVMRPMNQRELRGGGHGRPWLERLVAGEFEVSGTQAAEMAVETIAESGFPGAATSSHPTAWLEAYGAAVAERSIDERRDPQRVSRLLRVLAALEAAAVPEERIWTTADINRETWRSYDNMLARTHTVTPAPAWQSNRLKRLTAFPKRYFADSALALAVAGIGVEELQDDPALAGKYFDSFIAGQLRPEADAVGAQLSHLRTKGGERELDLVIDLQGKLVVVEMKMGTRPTASDAKHLSWARTEFGDQIEAAILLHRGSNSFEIAEGVWAVPATRLWSKVEDPDSAMR